MYGIYKFHHYDQSFVLLRIDNIFCNIDKVQVYANNNKSPSNHAKVDRYFACLNANLCTCYL